MLEFQIIIASSNDISVISKYYSKKFAREAEWEAWKDRYYRVMDMIHVGYHSYAEEYEEFVAQKLKQQSKSRVVDCTNKHDYYSLLGVDRCASEEEIKRSFRVLIMQVHPDYCMDIDAEERAKELIEAYQTLRNPQKRYLYDLSLH